MHSHFTGRLVVISTLLVSVHSAATAVKRVNTSILEDRFIELFGNDPTEIEPWYAIRNWWYMIGEPTLRGFCTEVHQLAGRGECVVDYVLFKWRQLNFTKGRYPSRKIDVVEYSIESAKKPKRTTTTTDTWQIKKGGKRWWIAMGLELDCVFDLKLIDKEKMVFNLHKHVCGIKDISPFTTPDLNELLKSVSPFQGGTGMHSWERALGTPSDDESDDC